MMKRRLLTLLFVVAMGMPLLAQVYGTGGIRKSVALKYGAEQIGRRTDAEMNRWRDSGVGQFIHWGVYSIPGGHWDGRYVGQAAEWIRSSLKSDEKKAYDELYKEFNPKDFDAKVWAKQAKAMGAKYVIFTTKHHDGFCMWPSKFTDYTIGNSPYKKDIVKQIVDAYTAEGIDVHLYFSIIDWNHPGFRDGAGRPKLNNMLTEWDKYEALPNAEDKAAYETFKTFTRNQLLELLENYPKIKGLWFDGSWSGAWMKEATWVGELNKELRAKHKDLIIGSRFRNDEHGNRGYDANGDLIGDYDQSWERDVPPSYEYTKGVDWDCIMTTAENGWGYHSAPRGYVKSPYNFVELLVQCVAMDGNFVLNFGPDKFGKTTEIENKVASYIADWMKINGEAIHGATHMPWLQQGWGYYTRKGNKVYMNVFNIPINNKLLVRVPRSTVKPAKATFMKDGKPVEMINGGRNKANDNLFYIQLPENFSSKDPFVIVLDLEVNKDDKDTYEQART